MINTVNIKGFFLMQNNIHFRATYICNRSMKICTRMKSIKCRIVVPSEGEENTTGKQ